MAEKPCTKCKQVKPLEEYHRAGHTKDGRRTKCRQCEAEEAKARWQAKIDERKAAQKARRARDREKIAERKRAYQASGVGKQKMLAGSKRYRQTERGRENARERQRLYSQTEQGRLQNRIRCSRRRALLIQAAGSFTAEEWRATVERQKNQCLYCQREFTERLPATMDHVIPLSKDGAHEASNIVAACKPCNSRKWNRLHEDGSPLVDVVPPSHRA
jgi:5-methylcytosine-specific restriction endonuclease McrA